METSKYFYCHLLQKNLIYEFYLLLVHPESQPSYLLAGAIVFFVGFGDRKPLSVNFIFMLLKLDCQLTGVMGEFFGFVKIHIGCSDWNMTCHQFPQKTIAPANR